MTLRQATFYGRCALAATVALLALGILVDTFWNPPTRVRAVVFLPSLISACVFIHWRGWVGGWKCRHEEWVERTPRANAILGIIKDARPEEDR